MTGSHHRKWDRTGVITQIGDNGQYLVRVDGSHHVTLQNRQFLRRYSGYATTLGTHESQSACGQTNGTDTSHVSRMDTHQGLGW
jgi:hypothetical protein